MQIKRCIPTYLPFFVLLVVNLHHGLLVQWANHEYKHLSSLPLPIDFYCESHANEVAVANLTTFDTVILYHIFGDASSFTLLHTRSLIVLIIVPIA